MLRILLAALVVVVVAGTIAGAAPGLHRKPASVPSVVPAESESPEPTETESPEPAETETEGLETSAASDGSGTAPDFSKCDGLTGLDNAICRHEALLKIHRDNPGLANSLVHLQGNLAKHAAEASGAHGASGSHGSPGSEGS